jgi:hypothetical protein
MGDYRVDVDRESNTLEFRLEGQLTPEDARAFVREHNAAVDQLRDQDYVVFGDLRALRPLSPECAGIVEEAKRYSARQQRFRGSAILVQQSVVALQHRRTSISGGVMSTELIAVDEAECRAYLASLRTAAKK